MWKVHKTCDEPDNGDDAGTDYAADGGDDGPGGDGDDSDEAGGAGGAGAGAAEKETRGQGY